MSQTITAAAFGLREGCTQELRHELSCSIHLAAAHSASTGRTSGAQSNKRTVTKKSLSTKQPLQRSGFFHSRCERKPLPLVRPTAVNISCFKPLTLPHPLRSRSDSLTFFLVLFSLSSTHYKFLRFRITTTPSPLPTITQSPAMKRNPEPKV